MKVLLSDSTYAYLQPGGKNTHITKLHKYHNINGVECKYESFFEPGLDPDVVHFLGYNDIERIKLLKRKGKKLILTHIVDDLTNLKGIILLKRRIIIFFQSILPSNLDRYIKWKALKYFDHIVYMHENDRNTAIKFFSIDQEKTSIIPHGIDKIPSFDFNYSLTEDYLISVGSIIPRKNSSLLAKICLENNIPIVFIGSSDKNSKYFETFKKNVDGKTVKYLGYVSEIEKQRYLSKAKGFIILSNGESGCISIYEAASFGLPIFLSDLPWSYAYPSSKLITRSKINEYTFLTKNINKWEKKLKKKRTNKPSFSLLTWRDISNRYIKIYNTL